MANEIDRRSRSAPTNLGALRGWLALAAVIAIVLLVLVGGAWAMNQATMHHSHAGALFYSVA